MPALFLALLTSALATVGGRPALLTARLAGGLGSGVALLAACWATAAMTSALAAWAAAWLAPMMVPAAKTMFVAAALFICGVELLVIGPARATEPTRSLGAISLVLFAGQLTDAARLLVLALALATVPALAAAGGTVGSGAVLTVAWTLGAEWETRLPLKAIRRMVAALLLLSGVIVALAARGVIG